MSYDINNIRYKKFQVKKIKKFHITLKFQNHSYFLKGVVKKQLAKRMKDASWPLIGTTSAMVSRLAFKNSIKTSEILTCLSEMASEVFRLSFRCCYFVVKKKCKSTIENQNSREKLSFEGAEMYLELRSSTFGEKCICKFMSEFQWD